MLDELIKTMDYGVSYGSGALKALQNDNLPEIDLLVREAIQNSSDASIGKKGEKRFDVNFNFGKFSPSLLNEELGSLKDVLNRRRKEEEAYFLEIRDMRTSGLTGCVRLSELDREDHGNYFKLVFDTGKEQTASSSGEAGGSWGYGKSVYYRAGIGIVIFYSQIPSEIGYEERLIIGLTEHENDKESLLKEICSDSVGRAWWGRKDSDNNNELLPVTDASEIQKILDIFNLYRFKEGQTGTSIIIPYIDEKRLLEGIFPDDCGVSDDEKAMCVWKDNVEKYLELAVQKWYAPKIFNKNLENNTDQKWLAVKVNGNAIKDDTMRPLFQLVQELYTTALYSNIGKKYESGKFEGIECTEIPSQRVVGQKTGHVAYIKVSKDQLSSSGSVISPYTYLRLFIKSPLNDPIVMFARTPGLVLDYKIDGKWTKGLTKPENDDEFIFAFYVPNCSLQLKNDPIIGEYAGKSFGEYLRKCEKSDHMDWDDKSNLSIVGNIKSQVVNKINNGLKYEDKIPVEGTTSKLSGKLGRRLLPKIGFGKKPGSGGFGGGNSGGGVKFDNLEMELVPKIYADSMELAFRLTFKNIRKSAAIGIFIESEVGVLDADTWESEIGKPFPLMVERIENVKTYAKNSSKEQIIENVCTINCSEIQNEFTSVKLIKSKSGYSIAGLKISNEITNAIVTGDIMLKTKDRKYVCTIKEISDS